MIGPGKPGAPVREWWSHLLIAHARSQSTKGKQRKIVKLPKPPPFKSLSPAVVRLSKRFGELRKTRTGVGRD